jgi:hypothetical protein
VNAGVIEKRVDKGFGVEEGDAGDVVGRLGHGRGSGTSLSSPSSVGRAQAIVTSIFGVHA